MTYEGHIYVLQSERDTERGEREGERERRERERERDRERKRETETETEGEEPVLFYLIWGTLITREIGNVCVCVYICVCVSTNRKSIDQPHLTVNH